MTSEVLKFITEVLHIDMVILLLIIAGGFAAKRYLDGWTHIRIGTWRPKFQMAWKTLIVGSVFTTGYLLFRIYVLKKYDQDFLNNAILTYVFTTSFYELIIGPVVAHLKNVLKKITPAIPNETPEE